MFFKIHGKTVQNLLLEASLPPSLPPSCPGHFFIMTTTLLRAYCVTGALYTGSLLNFTRNP